MDKLNSLDNTYKKKVTETNNKYNFIYFNKYDKYSRYINIMSVL